MKEVRHLLEKLGQAPDPLSLRRLERHHELVLVWNGRAHLVSAADASPDGLQRHDLESLQALPFLSGRRRVVDIGSGGGFPALVWACLLPDLEMMLVESNARKAAFLREAAHKLALPSVQVLPRRIDSGSQLIALEADLWTSRAAGCLSLLIESACDDPGGRHRLVLYPGADEAASISERMRPGWKRVSDQPLLSGAAGRLVVIDT